MLPLSHTLLLFLFSLAKNALSSGGTDQDCSCNPCTDGACRASGGTLTYCSIVPGTDSGCISGCFYTELDSGDEICTNMPLPVFRDCNCDTCTEETCGATWSGLTYCALNNGTPPYPSNCISGCYFHDPISDGGVCTNQLLANTIECGNSSCPISSCGTTTCDESSETCSHNCAEGCCYSLDSNFCQPCTIGGNIITKAIDTIFPIWAIVLTVLAALIVVVLVVAVVMTTCKATTTSTNYQLFEKLQ